MFYILKLTPSFMSQYTIKSRHYDSLDTFYWLCATQITSLVLRLICFVLERRLILRTYVYQNIQQVRKINGFHSDLLASSFIISLVTHSNLSSVYRDVSSIISCVKYSKLWCLYQHKHCCFSISKHITFPTKHTTLIKKHITKHGP